MAKRSFYINESEFDDYQLQVVRRRIDNSFLVKGNAGSGKSILALWKVKQIQEENKGSFYFIVFTKTLKQYMEEVKKWENLGSKIFGGCCGTTPEYIRELRKFLVK